MIGETFSSYETIVMGAIGLFAAVVAVRVALKVLAWLYEVVASASERLVNGLAAAIIRLLQNAFGCSARILKALGTAAFKPVCQVVVECHGSALELLKLWQLYGRCGRSEFRSFRSFCKYMRGEGDDREKDDRQDQEEKAHSGKPADAYRDAIRLLGFAETDAFDRALLKQRHRKLMSRVHPDKGCPTSVLAQQINDAVSLVRKRKGWR